MWFKLKEYNFYRAESKGKKDSLLDFPVFNKVTKMAWNSWGLFQAWYIHLYVSQWSPETKRWMLLAFQIPCFCETNSFVKPKGQSPNFPTNFGNPSGKAQGRHICFWELSKYKQQSSQDNYSIYLFIHKHKLKNVLFCLGFFNQKNKFAQLFILWLNDCNSNNDK